MAQKNSYSANLQLAWLIFWTLAIALSFLGAFRAKASQLGPFFPTHRFPTDESYHLGYNFSLISSGANYTSNGVQDLSQTQHLQILQHEILAEFQPNRSLSLGLLLNFEGVKISNDSSGTYVSNQSLGDQRIFSEYRFYDVPGNSAGVAILVKFPGYKNPSVQEIKSNQVVLLGDAQTDFSGLLTSEHWFTRTLRSRLDVGYTYRTEQFSGEIPFLVSIAYVNPKLEVELRFRGNASLGNDSFDSSNTDISTLQHAFGSSSFAYSKNPWIGVIEPHLEFWTSARLAIIADFSLSVMGNNSPKYFALGGGVTYRWAETKIRERRTFQEVDIETDQESGKFQGEEMEKLEPKPSNPGRIQEEPQKGDEGGPVEN